MPPTLSSRASGRSATCTSPVGPDVSRIASAIAGAGEQREQPRPRRRQGRAEHDRAQERPVRGRPPRRGRAGRARRSGAPPIPASTPADPASASSIAVAFVEPVTSSARTGAVDRDRGERRQQVVSVSMPGLRGARRPSEGTIREWRANRSSWSRTAARSPCASSARAARWASPRSPCTPTPTATRCTSRWPTRPTGSAPRSPPTPTSRSARSSRPRRESEATLVHPGYGFLAERAHFAQAVGEAGLTFVGPSPEAIEEMGDKAAARRIADAAGMPIVPGHAASRSTSTQAKKQAPRIGYPLLVKAAFGGGGKGMHVVRDARAPRGVAQAGGARGAVVLRTPRGVPRALRRPRAPRRGADHRRHARQRPVPGRARLLGAAPTPEADRGDAVAAGRRRDPRAVRRGGGRARARRPATSTPARSSASSTRTARSTSSR